MKCQPVLWGKNKKNVIKLSSAELARRVVKVQLGPSIMFTLILTLSNSLYLGPINMVRAFTNFYIVIYIFIYLHNFTCV